MWLHSLVLAQYTGPKFPAEAAAQLALPGPQGVAVQAVQAVHQGVEAGVALDRAPAEKIPQAGVRAVIGHAGPEVEQIVVPVPPEAQLGLPGAAAVGQAAGGKLIAATQPGAGVHLLLQIGAAGRAAGAEIS